MNYYFHPESLHEFIEAVRYYSNISRSLANAFVAQVEHGINQILLFPETWAEIEPDIRRYLIKRFPFAIFYTIETNDTILIHAIMHLSRKPGFWKDRITTNKP